MEEFETGLFRPGDRVYCPYCGVFVGLEASALMLHYQEMYPNIEDLAPPIEHSYIMDGNRRMTLFSSTCPQCDRCILSANFFDRRENLSEDVVLYPKTIARTLPDEVPSNIAQDYIEASAVLSFSARASAALSRRCLESVLVDQGFRKGSLDAKIGLASKELSTHLSKNIDALRKFGNVSAHPPKVPEAIVDIEFGEAEWCLDVLDLLFEHYYVAKKKAENMKREAEKKHQKNKFGFETNK